MRRDLGIRKTQFLAFRIRQADHRTQIFTGGSALLGISDHKAGQTGDVIGMFVNGYTISELMEFNRTGNLGNNRVRVRVPVGHDVAGVNLLSLSRTEMIAP